jgi:hypothetical protein
MANAVMLAAAAAKAERDKVIAAADAAWRPYAEACGLSYTPGRIGEFDAVPPRLEGVRDGIEIVVQLDADEVRTAVVARPPVPLAGNVAVSREGFVAKLTKLVGAQDVILEDARFDPAYLVKASNEAVAKALLVPEVRAGMLELDADGFAYDDGAGREGGKPAVAVFVTRLLDTPGALDVALRVVLAAARVRSEGPYR